MKPTIKKVVEGVSMGLGHMGLTEFLKRHANIDVTQLTGSDLIMCINGYGDKMKVIGAKGLVIGYLRMPHRQKIMKEALQFIPKTFGAGGFNYDQACVEALTYRLSHAQRKNPLAGPLHAARAMKSAGW